MGFSKKIHKNEDSEKNVRIFHLKQKHSQKNVSLSLIRTLDDNLSLEMTQI